MHPGIEFGRKLWSWFAPLSVDVQLVSQRQPAGQLDLHPEYSVAGIPLTHQELSSKTSANGYRFKLTPSVANIKDEFQDLKLRLRPGAVAEWLRKYADVNVPVVDAETGRPPEAFTAEVEFEFDLNPDKTANVRAALSRPNGVEIDFSQAVPIPSEPGWFQLDETIFERPPLSPALDAVLSGPDQSDTVAGDAVPEMLYELDTHSVID